MKHNCKECDRRFEGRKNKKYCSLQCKNASRMKQYKNKHKKVLQTSNMIQRNAKIIERIYANGITQEIKYSQLIQIGLNPAFTNCRRADGHLEFDAWVLEEIGHSHYKIHPPKNTKK